MALTGPQGPRDGKLGLFSRAIYILIYTHQVNPYDPGICTKQKRGKFVVVMDRNDDDKIVVCVRHHGKYQWNVMNGRY